MTAEDITHEIERLTPLRGTGLSKYQEMAVKTGRGGYNVQVLVKYLAACGHHIMIKDLLGDEFHIKELKDFDSVVTGLAKKYNRTLGKMKGANNVSYTVGCCDTRAFSVTTLIKVLNYFKCNFRVVSNEQGGSKERTQIQTPPNHRI